MKKTRIFFLLLALCSTFLFLAGIGRRDLWSPDEPRVAGIAAEMAREGDLVVPSLNGLPFLEKPPLYFWAASAIMKLLGESAWTARLPSALAGILGVLILFLLVRSMDFSPLSAFLSGLVLATSAEYWELGQKAVMDMPLCLFITAAMAAYYHASRNTKRTWPWYAVFVLCLSCALMTKGLVGLAIPLCGLVSWLAIRKDFTLSAWARLAACSALAFIPALIWIGFLHDRLGWDAVHHMVWFQNMGRFIGSETSHIQPFWYYLAGFPLQFLPWTLFLPLAGLRCVEEIRQEKKESSCLFLLSWFIASFILLSLSAGKRGLYLLPLYPTAAGLVGVALGAALESAAVPGRLYRVPVLLVTVLLILVPLAYGGACIHINASLIVLVPASFPGLFFGFWALRRYVRRDWVGAFKITAATLVILYVTMGFWIRPLFNPSESFAPLFEYCNRRMAEGARLGIYGRPERLRGAAAFYLRRIIPELNGTGALKGFLAADQASMVLAQSESVPEGEPVRVLRSFEIGRRNYLLLGNPPAVLRAEECDKDETACE